jgi:hypothetical protein
MRILAGALLVTSAWIGLALVGFDTFPKIFQVYIVPWLLLIIPASLVAWIILRQTSGGVALIVGAVAHIAIAIWQFLL